VIKAKSHLFPAWLSFILNNPIRRRLHAPHDILGRLNVKNTDVVIDFGCGPGFYTILFAKVAARVIAIDVQSEMLEKTMNYARKNQVKVECLESDGRKIPLPNNTADLIFLSEVFHELNDKSTILRELSRLLKLNGRLIIKEKTKRGLRLVGPPIVEVSEIATHLENIGLRVRDKIEIGNDTMILATK